MGQQLYLCPRINFFDCGVLYQKLFTKVIFDCLNCLTPNLFSPFYLHIYRYIKPFKSNVNFEVPGFIFITISNSCEAFFLDNNAGSITAES